MLIIISAPLKGPPGNTQTKTFKIVNRKTLKNLFTFKFSKDISDLKAGLYYIFISAACKKL